MNHRTNFFASATLDTSAHINPWIEKPFPILLHDDTLFRTTLSTGRTTTTIFFIMNDNHDPMIVELSFVSDYRHFKFLRN